ARERNPKSTTVAIPETVQTPSPSSPIQRQLTNPKSEIENPKSLQALPLQEPWPVQRSPQASLPEPAPEPPVAGEIAPPDPTMELRLQEVLGSVQPGQPTGSSLEVIPPRRA